ncbi:MAG: HIRAN domain-containing protein [Oscillospiraceae bacterium]|jgi:hypothetical protein
MKERYVTVTGFQYYYDKQPFSIGNLIRCQKEPENPHDSEAIRCSLPMIGTVGYLANSPRTVAGGTMSAGRIYDHVKKRFHVRVMFTTTTKIICKLELGDRQKLEQELNNQMHKHWEDENWTD